MKIKKLDDKPMLIHMKEKAKLHVMSVTQGPKIIGVKGKIGEKTTDKRYVVKAMTVQRRKNTNLKIGNKKNIYNNKRESNKQAVQNESSIHSQHQNAKKDREAAIGKKSASIKTVGAVGVGVALKQMEGGDELHKSAIVMPALARSVTSAAKAGSAAYTSDRQQKNRQRSVSRK